LIGKTLAHYEVLEPLGAGGMGEVYRARDTNLKRDVAIKVLPDDLADDPERLTRLEREAHLLASLNHPNIATIFSLEEADGTRFLVLELIEGESLQARLARGPLPVEDALDICGQIARALEVAHEAGIVHRDLKPANVLITPDDRAKVLDFGIAKTLRPVGESDDTVHATELTIAGTLVGTAPYMSPEQVRGEAVDKRSDIWAFGCVFFETLSGAGPFTRETAADTLAAIVGEEPHWESLPSEVSAAVRSLLHRCLQKSPKVRQRDIGDAWVEINQSLTHPGGVPMSLPPTIAGVDSLQLGWGVAAGLVVAALAAGAVAGWRLGPEAPSVSSPLQRFAFDLALGASLPVGVGGNIAISPDGAAIAYAAEGSFGIKLFVRRLDQLGSEEVEGTDGAGAPFFSPDGVWLAFDRGDGIEAVSLAGGDGRILCAQCRRGTWADDDSIIVHTELFASGWARIPEEGAEMKMLPALTFEGRALNPTRLHALPGSQGVLFQDGASIYAVSLETYEVVEVATPGSDPAYADSGHVLFPRGESTLYAVPFDVATLNVIGDPLVAQRQVGVEDGGSVHAAVSRNGVLAFAPTRAGSRLVWVDRTGNWVAATEDEDWRLFTGPRVSPDGTAVAVVVRDTNRAPEVWVIDDSMGTLRFLVGDARMPVWARDSSQITYLTPRDAEMPGEPRQESVIFRQLADGTGVAEPLLAGLAPPALIPQSWTPDDRRLIYRGDQDSVHVLEVGSDVPQPSSLLFEDEFAKYSFTLSHTGRWLAYVSEETGSPEVYVRDFQGPGRALKVSASGGRDPVWGPDDRELFYIVDNRLMVAQLPAGDEFQVSRREPLFDTSFYPSVRPASTDYDIHPDGDRFIMIRPVAADEGRPKINVVLNWFGVFSRPVSEQR